MVTDVNTPRYLLAKYVPDLLRMEPVNIGVIVWAPSGVAARFVGERPEAPGEVDGRSVPSYVQSTSAYKQWVAYWQNQLRRREIAPVQGGEAVEASSPDFPEVLKTASRGNFLLTDGGVLLDPLVAGEVASAADYLFTQLVQGDDEPVRDPRLEEVCESLLSESHLGTNPHFVRRIPIQCKVSGTLVENFEFSYGFQNGSLHRLYQRVPLTQRKVDLDRTVRASTYMFEKVAASDIIQRDQAVALVYVPDERDAPEDVVRSLRLLDTAARVVNVARQTEALNEFRLVAEMAQSI